MADDRPGVSDRKAVPLLFIRQSVYESERIWLRQAKGKWFLCSEAWWPAHAGASNGGCLETELNAEFFRSRHIAAMDGLLFHILGGSEEKRLMAKSNAEAMRVPEALLENYAENGSERKEG